MITAHALEEAIAEVQGKRNPDRNDCIMLAAFYTLQDHLFPASYSHAAESTETPQTPSGKRYGESEFLQAVSDADDFTAWSVMDELMSTLRVVNKRVYDSVMRKLR